MIERRRNRQQLLQPSTLEMSCEITHLEVTSLSCQLEELKAQAKSKMSVVDSMARASERIMQRIGK